MRSARFDGSCFVQQDDLIGTKRHVHSLGYGENALPLKMLLDSRTHPRIKLLIVGSPFFGRTQQSPFLRKLEQQAETLGDAFRGMLRKSRPIGQKTRKAGA